jgi:hypothetical protein
MSDRLIDQSLPETFSTPDLALAAFEPDERAN